MFKGKGFTLVELLVVIVIIGILVALILPNTLRAIRQANTKECASNIRSIDTAIQMFYTENRAWPALGGVVPLQTFFPDEDGDGIGDTPVCPFGVAYTIIADAATGGVRADRGPHFAVGDWPITHQ